MPGHRIINCKHEVQHIVLAVPGRGPRLPKDARAIGEGQAELLGEVRQDPPEFHPRARQHRQRHDARLGRLPPPAACGGGRGAGRRGRAGKRQRHRHTAPSAAWRRRRPAQAWFSAPEPGTAPTEVSGIPTAASGALGLSPPQRRAAPALPAGGKGASGTWVPAPPLAGGSQHPHDGLNFRLLLVPPPLFFQLLFFIYGWLVGFVQ